ncbi:MAG: hypothetical protein ACN6O6_22790 [Pseudomonas sp.]|uniref:hypothetical protein n=1 Tax=Pseudomonas sp. TaxID=306 RepID=UPI003D1456A6
MNEYISDDDIKKYGIEEINRRFLKPEESPSWTVDRGRDVYLRLVASGREEFAREKDFTLYWGGEVLVFRLERTGGGVRGEEGWSHHKLLREDIPDNMKAYRDKILTALKESLIAYKDAGVYSTTSKHVATFDF